MAVTGSCDGLIKTNQYGQKVQPLISVSQLKDEYLTGLDIKIPSTGAPLPDTTYQSYINNAVSWLEHYLDISITPVIDYVENLDYDRNAYSEWGYIRLHNVPVISVTSMEMVYFRDQDGAPETLQTLPASWIRLQPHDGIIRLIPNARFGASLQIGRTGSFFPEILQSGHVPHLWRITYSFGFRDGEVPVALNQAVAMLASLQALSVGGNLVLGAGIAGSSISLDGLSQSIQTTQSAENSAYSATRGEYIKQLMGTRQGDPHALLTILHNYYQGQSMHVF